MYGQYPYPTYQNTYQRQMANIPMQQYQPQPQMQPQPQQPYEIPIQETRYVTRKEAEGFIVFPNTKVLLIDKNEGMAYLKSADNMGQSSTLCFKFEGVNPDGSPLKPQEEKPQIDMNEYIKKSDLASFGFVTIDQLDKAIEKLTINNSKPQNSNKGAQGSNSRV
jgi:hypothetical protein